MLHCSIGMIVGSGPPDWLAQETTAPNFLSTYNNAKANIKENPNANS